MNIQSLMKQAQAMQKNLLESKKEIENKVYEGESELVKAIVNGKKQVVSIKFKNVASFDLDDLEILEDMVMIAVNNAIDKVEKEIKNKMGNQMGPLGDLF